MEKVCPVCGKNFETHDKRQKYCSAECAKQAKLERNQKYKKPEGKRQKNFVQSVAMNLSRQMAVKNIVRPNVVE